MGILLSDIEVGIAYTHLDAVQIPLYDFSLYKF